MVVSFRISAYSRKQWPLTEKGNKGAFRVQGLFYISILEVVVWVNTYVRLC